MESTIYTMTGASNHSDTTREEYDFYTIFLEVMDKLFEVEKFSDTIRELACGVGRLSKRIIELGKEAYSTDLISRGYDTGGVGFLKVTGDSCEAVTTNPPYKIALELTEKALDTPGEGIKIAMFLKPTFLEGRRRKPFSQTSPPLEIHVSSSRAVAAKGGDSTIAQANGNTIAYA